MNAQLTQAFAYEGHTIRTAGTPEAPLFVAKDVCEVLEIGNSRQALARLDDDEKGVISNDTLGGTQQLQAVTESGLYSLILGSRKKEARQFKRWVTHEVLPAIRKTGQYSVQQDRMSRLRALQETIALQIEQEERLREHEQRLDLIEAHQNRLGSGYVSVRGYCNLNHLPCGNSLAAAVGKRAAAIAREEGIQIFETPDERHGKVNIYPHEVVRRALVDLGQIKDREVFAS